MDDTSIEMAEKMREMFRNKTPTERHNMAWSMYEASRYLIVRSILEHNPNISKAAFQKELFIKFYGNDFDSAEQEKIFEHFNRIYS